MDVKVDCFLRGYLSVPPSPDTECHRWARFPEYIFQAEVKAPFLGPEASFMVAGQEIQLVSPQGIKSSHLGMVLSSQLQKLCK